MSTEPMADVAEAVRSNYASMTQSQKRIAEAIVEDPEFVAFSTVDKLAQRLGVASSTIVRFAYKLGLDGYPALQDCVRQQVRRQYRNVSAREGGDGEIVAHLGETGFAASFDRDLRQLRRTIASLDADLLERSVQAIERARRVYICGDLTSFALAHFAAIAIGRAREDVRLVRADAEGVTALLGIGAADVLLSFSFPPYSRNVRRVVDWANERRATTLGVTDAAFSPLGQRVDIVLAAVASGVGPINTLVPGLAIVNALVNGFIQRDEQQVLQRYRDAAGLATQWDLFVLGPDDES